MQPVIAWSERALVLTSDGRVFDCCEFELLPDVDNRKATIHGLMGWRLRPDVSLEDAHKLSFEERQTVYLTGTVEIAGYEPFNPSLPAFAGFLSEEFMNMTASRSSSLMFWAS